MTSNGLQRRQLMHLLATGVAAAALAPAAAVGATARRLTSTSTGLASDAPALHHFMDRLTSGVGDEPGYMPPSVPAWALAHTAMDHERLGATRYPL